MYQSPSFFLLRIGIGFDGAETNCGIARINFRHPTDEQLRQLDIFRSRTSDRGLSSLNSCKVLCIF